MHDIRLIREAPAAFDAALGRRGLAPVSAGLLALDERRRGLIHAAETALAERNAASKAVGAANLKLLTAAGGTGTPTVLHDGAQVPLTDSAWLQKIVG